jgi:hypothetical protein
MPVLDRSTSENGIPPVDFESYKSEWDGIFNFVKANKKPPPMLLSRGWGK